METNPEYIDHFRLRKLFFLPRKSANEVTIVAVHSITDEPYYVVSHLSSQVRDFDVTTAHKITFDEVRELSKNTENGDLSAKFQKIDKSNWLFSNIF